MRHHINILRTDQLLVTLPQSEIARRRVPSMDHLVRVVEAIESHGLPVSAAWVDAEDVLDRSGAQYYYDFRIGDYDAVAAILKEIR